MIIKAGRIDKMHAQNSSIEYYGSGRLTFKFKRYGQLMGVAITALKNLNPKLTTKIN